jgi:hypothetical protein
MARGHRLGVLGLTGGVGRPALGGPLVALVLLVGCTPREEARRWKVTVEVETLAGLVTGSGVVETRYRPRNERLSTLDSAQRRVVGEAIAVDLPGGMLVALLEREGDYGFFFSSMRDFAWLPDADGGLRRVPIHYGSNDPTERADWQAAADRYGVFRAEEDRALAERRPLALLEEGWPRFVLLTDPTDPRSALSLSPSEDAEAALGEIRVRRVVVQETDEPVTRTLAARLPWLVRSGMPISGRNVYPPQIPADGLLAEDFSTLLK